MLRGDDLSDTDDPFDSSDTGSGPRQENVFDFNEHYLARDKLTMATVIDWKRQLPQHHSTPIPALPVPPIAFLTMIVINEH